MGIITGLGWLFSGAIKFVPGLPKSVFMAVAVLACLGLLAGYAYHKGSEGRGAAVAAEKAACEVKIANIERASELTISDILKTVQEGETSDPGPTTKAELDSLCAKSPMCRENSK